MIEVDGVKVPDPKVSNPELFDLTSTDSPIVQFANAFGVKPEEVGNLTPQLLTGVDGKQFVVLTTGDLAATANFDESGTPLLIAEQGENGEWKWSTKVTPELANALNKKVGVFVDPRFNKPNTGILTDNFNLISPGAFSWDWIRRKGSDINSIDLALADQWVNFAKQNGMSVINGNPLVYHLGLPEWLTTGNFTKDELTRIMTEHIKTVVGHYAGKGITWEVLNEAVWYSQGNTGYQNSIWYKTIGNEYINLAFQAAREADPSAKLLYKDTLGDEGQISNSKANIVFNLVKDVKQKGLVDEVGLQLHIPNPETAPSEEEIIAQIQRYAEIGVPVNFTEVDVNIKPLLDKGMTLQEALLKQAEIYQIIVSACAKSSNCKTINTWGLNDSESWLGPDSRALLFSSNVPKPAFFGIMRGMTDALTLQVQP
jgi:endo-1,4-beta-xylanase